jgi:hypothetical protein
MQSLKVVASELFGLFVDDVSFAVAIIVWLGIVWIASTRFFPDSDYSGVALFAGFGLILLVSTVRRSRQ